MRPVESPDGFPIINSAILDHQSIAPCLINASSLRSASFQTKGRAMRILVADKLAKEGLEVLKNEQIDFDEKVGLKEEELAAAVGAFDALVVRSGAKVTAKV